MKMVIEKYSQKVIKYIEKYNLDEIVQFDNCVPQISTYESVDKNNKESYPPDWNDLIRLHNIIVSRKVTTILEFGVGYSTLICAHALNYNKQQHKKFVSDNIRSLSVAGLYFSTQRLSNILIPRYYQSLYRHALFVQLHLSIPL